MEENSPIVNIIGEKNAYFGMGSDSEPLSSLNLINTNKEKKFQEDGDRIEKIYDSIYSNLELNPREHPFFVSIFFKI